MVAYNEKKMNFEVILSKVKVKLTKVASECFVIIKTKISINFEVTWSKVKVTFTITD